VRPAAVIASCILVCSLGPAALGADRFNLPDGPGRDLVYGHCQTCHDLQSVVDSAGIRRGAWDAVLANMDDFGLRISDDQRAKILDYLGTYLGPNPPPPEAAPPVAESAADGAQVFADTCIACHQEDGKGKPEEFPPLAGNHDLFLAPEFPAKVALFGLAGAIEVGGEPFDNEMPSFDFLSNEEIAAVVAYVRLQWGNNELRPANFPELTAADVATLRKSPRTPADVHTDRQALLK
jgi:mono/diheme cytochrome c family protein